MGEGEPSAVGRLSSRPLAGARRLCLPSCEDLPAPLLLRLHLRVRTVTGGGLRRHNDTSLGEPLRREKPSPSHARPPRSAALRRRAFRGDRTYTGSGPSEATGGLLKQGPANNSLEPTRKRRAKMEEGLADVATTRSRGAIADEGPSG